MVNSDNPRRTFAAGLASAGAADRLLGIGWASIHGPAADPGSLARWTLDLGFRGFAWAPSPRPVDALGLRRAAQDLPFRLAALRVAAPDQPADRLPDAGLASRNEAESAAAVSAVGRAAELAVRLGIDRVVLEPGVVPRSATAEEAGPVDLADEGAGWTAEAAQAKKTVRDRRLEGALDAACRALHALCTRFPDLTFCLAPSRHVAGLGEPAALEAIFDDLARHDLAYWHDTALAHRRQTLLGEAEGAWLEAFAPRLAGVTLGDADPAGRLHLPPGAGLVDFPLLAGYVARTGPGGRAPDRVVELRPDVEPDEIPGVHAFLSKYAL